MLVEAECAGFQLADEAVHCEMEGGVVPLHCGEEGADGNVGIEFFADFAFQGLLRGFVGLDFTAWEFPPALPFAVSALGGEDLVVAEDDGGYDVEGGALLLFNIIYMP